MDYRYNRDIKSIQNDSKSKDVVSIQSIETLTDTQKDEGDDSLVNFVRAKTICKDP